MLFVKNLMVAFLATLSLCSLAFAQEATNEERVWLTYKEEVITAKTPFKAGFFSSEKEVEVYGVLWTPRLKKGEQPKKLPLFVMNHGSQNSQTKEVVTAQADGSVLTLLENGFAVLAPIRNGFRRATDPSPEVRVGISEPESCDWSTLDLGVTSAKNSVKSVVRKLQGREDIDLSRIVVAGQSRGGFLALALAAEQTMGVVGVVNLVGGWHREPCGSSGNSYNMAKLAQFAKEIKVPIFSYYGTKDAFYSEEAVRTFVGILAENKGAVGVITPGYNHSAHRRDYEPWVAVATKLIKAE